MSKKVPAAILARDAAQFLAFNRGSEAPALIRSALTGMR